MLPSNPYLTAPAVTATGSMATADVALTRPERAAVRFTCLRTLAATGVVVLAMLATSAPSWAGPAGGC